MPWQRWTPEFERALLAWSEQHHLTSSEQRVVQCAVRGLSNKEIANELGIARTTVRTHLENIMRKTEVASRTELAYRFFTEAVLRAREGVERGNEV